MVMADGMMNFEHQLSMVAIDSQKREVGGC